MSLNSFKRINTKSKNILIFSFFVLLSFMVFTINYVMAEQTKEELSSSIGANKDQIAKLEQEIKDYQNKIGNTKEAATTLKSAISNLEARKSNLEKEISVANYKIGLTEANLENTEIKIISSTDKLNSVNGNIKDLLISAYQYSDSAQPFYSMLSSTKTFSDVNNVFVEQNSLSAKLYDKVNLLKTIKAELETSKEIYKDEAETLKDLQENLKDKKVVVEQSKAETNKLLKDTKNKEALYQQQLADRKKKKAAIEKEIADFESKLKAFTNVASLPKSGTGVLSYPLKNVKITQYFGNTPFSTQNPQVYSGMGHNGVDFAASMGTAVYSSADGVVMGVANSDLACPGVSFGKYVLIRHTNGLATLYAHLSSQSVSIGENVTSGQKIGLSGNTGYSTGPHLHFAVYAASAVHVAAPGEYTSKVCGTSLIIPIAPRSGYLNPLTYL